MSATENLASNDRSFARAERILYGPGEIASAEALCLVEGEIDKLSIDTAGGPPTARVPDGALPPDARNYTSKCSFLDETTMGTATPGASATRRASAAPGRRGARTPTRFS